MHVLTLYYIMYGYGTVPIDAFVVFWFLRPVCICFCLAVHPSIDLWWSIMILSIYPSYQSIHLSGYPAIDLSIDPPMDPSKIVYFGTVWYHGHLCLGCYPQASTGTTLTLWDSLNRLHFMHENPFGPKRRSVLNTSEMLLGTGCLSQEDQAKSPCLIVSWVSFSAKTSITSFKFQTHSENAGYASEKCLNSANEQRKWHLSSRVAPISSSGHLLSSSPGIYLTLRHREFYGLSMIVSRLMRQNPYPLRGGYVENCNVTISTYLEAKSQKNNLQLKNCKILQLPNVSKCKLCSWTSRKDFWLWIHGVAVQKRYKNTLLGSDIHGLFIGTLEKSSVLFARAI